MGCGPTPQAAAPSSAGAPIDDSQVTTSAAPSPEPSATVENDEAPLSVLEYVRSVLVKSAEGLNGYGRWDDEDVVAAFRAGQFSDLLAMVGSGGYTLDAPDMEPPLSTCPAEMVDPIGLCERTVYTAMLGFRRDLDLLSGPHVFPPLFEEDGTTIRVTFDLQGVTLEFSKEPLALTRHYVHPGRTEHN
jgi:hypothetical protein